MTEFTFFDSSDKAKVGKRVVQRKYPWNEVPAGKSFPVARENTKFNTLRSLASLQGKKLGKRFRVIDHGSGAYEVACLHMTEAEAVQASSNVVEALGKIKEGEE